MASNGGWWRWLIVAGALTGFVAVPLALDSQQERKPRDGRIILFFAPDAPPSESALRAISELLKARRDIALDTVLLVTDFARLAHEPSPAFQKAIKSLRELAGGDLALSLYDERGLELARRYGLSRLPATVVLRDGRAHVTYGASLELESLVRCK